MFSGFMGMQRRGMVVCGGVFMGFRCGLQRRVYGFPVWFAAARSVCSWVCVNFDLIFFVGHLLDSEFAIGLI